MGMFGRLGVERRLGVEFVLHIQLSHLLAMIVTLLLVLDGSGVLTY